MYLHFPDENCFWGSANSRDENFEQKNLAPAGWFTAYGSRSHFISKVIFLRSYQKEYHLSFQSESAGVCSFPFQPTVCNLFPLSNLSALEMNCRQPEHAVGVKFARSYRREGHRSSQKVHLRSILISKRELISKLYHFKISYLNCVIYHIKTIARHSTPRDILLRNFCVSLIFFY